MPPKKKKLTPIVVGTVSTRSTRRESIVNIEIIPKSSKSVVRSPALNKSSKKSSKTPNKKDFEQKKIAESEKRTPEILEILKDWSDDENSQDDSTFSISSGNTRISVVDKNEQNSDSLLVDQQSLIDILEGNHLEPRQRKSKENSPKHEQRLLSNRNKFTLPKELIIENPIVNIDSPQIDESEIIEECIVEDDGIIIELAEEQIEVTSQDCVGEDHHKKLNVNTEDNKLGSLFVPMGSKGQVQASIVDCNSDNAEQGSKSPVINKKLSKDCGKSKTQNQFVIHEEAKKIKKEKDISVILPEVKQSGDDLDENIKLSSCEIDEENQSMTSEDTTSQSMITVQDEDAYDINDIQMSDNSTNNYEVIEEQVVFDTSEPIIIENLENVHSDIEIKKNNLLENNELVLVPHEVQNITNQPESEKIKSSCNQFSGIRDLSESPHKGEVATGADKISKVQQQSVILDDNLVKSHKDKPCKKQRLPVNQRGLGDKILQSSPNLPKCKPSSLQKSSVMLEKSIGKCDDNASEIEEMENDKQQSSYITSLGFAKGIASKRHGQYLNMSDTQYETKTNSLNDQSDENTLCRQINEVMAISKETNIIQNFDPASDKLQEGIKKMYIQERCTRPELTEAKATRYRETRKKESKSSVDIESETNSKKPQLTSMEEKQSDNVLTLKNTLDHFQTNKEKSLMDSDTKKTPSSCQSRSDLCEVDITQRRRSTRRKPMGDEVQHSEIDKLEQSSNLQNISDKGSFDSEINYTFVRSSQDDQHSKSRGKGKKILKKEEKLLKTDSDTKIFDSELDANNDLKSSKYLKGRSNKGLENLAFHMTKMDVDSESSETKTSEAEGDSTSNESCQSSNSTNLYKTRTKNVLIKQAEELDKMKVESNLERTRTEINKSDLEIDISTDDNSQNKKPKGSKTKIRKSLTTTKVVDEEMEKMNINADNIKLQNDIDATIDEVLRKYSEDDAGTLDECAYPKEHKLKMTKEAKKKKVRKDEKYESSEEVRRSDRIKTILPVKKKSHGLVRSKSESALSVEAESSDSNSVHSEFDKATPVSPQLNKKYKAKSRAKSSESLQITNAESLPPENSPQLPKAVDLKADMSGKAEIEARLKSYVHLKENQYKTDRQICKEAREMICDCYLAEEDIQKDEYGCGEDCLNRLLMIECGHLCQIGDRCTNKRFQKGQFAPVEVFKTEKKGLGLIAAANIPYGEFILEYIGEVLNQEEFDKRAEVYSKDKNIHFYFMSLRADAIIDATMKGNISRFINHSCDPNAETQKWTVNGELRIGFFSTRTILAGEEVTFDYKFQRYGKEAQKCYCGAATCRGWLGERPDESEDEDEEDDEDPSKVDQVEITTAETKISTPDILETRETSGTELIHEKKIEKMEIDAKGEVSDVKVQDVPATPHIQETPKKVPKKKPRKELLFEDFDQLNEDIEMVVTTGLKNQAHTLKLSRLMVRAKDLDQRKKLLRVLRRGELPCRRLFLDYHGLRLMHGYMIDAQQLTNSEKKLNSQLDFLQTKLELLQTLAVLPIQNKTMLIESKVLPAVEKWAKNEDLVEDSIDHKEVKKSPEGINKQEDSRDPAVNEKIDEIKFLASKLLEEWVNLKQSFRIPKKQRIEQMKEHEKEANRKFVETSYTQEKESSRKNDQRYRSWSRYKSERETNKKGYREDKPSAEYLKMSKHERRKLFALQMELKEEERRLKQREMWRQHEMNCMMIGADPRFTAPFDPTKGFQYIWNPSIGQWQALPVPSTQDQGIYNSPAAQGANGFNLPPTSQGVSGYNVPPTHKQSLLGPYAQSMLNVSGMAGPAQQYPAPQKNSFNTGATCEMTRGMQSNIAPMVPGLSAPVSTMASTVSGIAASIPVITGLVPAMAGALHGISGSTPVIPGSVPGITQPPLPVLPMYPEVKHPEEDPSQVKFAGPIPPPVKLPPKWKCAKDKYGRPYYYHIKLRKSQWEPPPLPEDVEESSTTSSSETSSLSSSDSSSEPDTDDEIDDTKLLMEVRKQMESTSKFTLKSVIPQHVKKEEKDSATPSPEVKIESDNEDEPIEEPKEEMEVDNSEQLSSIDIRLKEQFNLDSNDPPKKKRRIGLCQEIIISPRTEEDRQQFKEDLKRYKATKDKLKRQKEHMQHQAKKKLKTSSSTDDSRRSRDKRILKSTTKSRKKQMEWNDEHAKKIKEVFRSTMATTVVGVLNAYRKPDCKESRITNTEDFKHLARKLTHFVMLKEMKHINTIEELICTDNVKAKAREYIKKYMSKFGEVYQKRHDEPDFKD